MSELLRYRDLEQYGVRNWVTLGRWIKDQGVPAGFYLGRNTRAWFKKDWDDWLANRPQAGARPPDIAKPRPCGDTQGTGLKAAHVGNVSTSTDRRIASFMASLPEWGAAHE